MAWFFFGTLGRQGGLERSRLRVSGAAVAGAELGRALGHCGR